jgi:hypothetical protein
MADAVQTLLVSLEARMGQYEREMRKASGTANKRMSEIDARLARTNRVLQGFGANAFRGLAGGAAAALAPILSVSAALNTAKAALTEFDRIGKSAKASGLDAEFFQGLEYSATLGGVGVDQLSTALAAFNRNAGMAAVGKGELVEKLKQLNPELLRNIILAQDQEARIRLVADAINRETDASRKAALAAAAFGDSGTRMVEMLKGGATALDDTANKARKLGIVIDRELIARGEELNDEFATATRVMQLEFQKALIDLAPVLIATAQLAGAVARGIGGIVDSMKALEARSSAGLEDRLAFLQAGSLGNGPGNRSDGADNKAAADEIAQIQAILRRRAIESLKEQLTAPKVVVDGAGIEMPDFDGSRAKAADDMLRQAEAVRDLVANLEHERAQLGRTSQEQELYNLLKQAGVERESEFGMAIEGALGPLQAQRTAIERNTAAMETMRSAADDALSGFLDDLAAGKDAGEAFRNVLAGIGSQLLRMGVSGLTGSIFPSSGGFGGFRANGGPVSPSKSYIVGERGPELFTPGVSGQIIPNPPPVMARGGSAGVSVPITISIDAKGADAAGLARVAGQIATLQAELPGRVKEIVRGNVRIGGNKWK